jgi:hypothetical protein
MRSALWFDGLAGFVLVLFKPSAYCRCEEGRLWLLVSEKTEIRFSSLERKSAQAAHHAAFSCASPLYVSMDGGGGEP